MNFEISSSFSPTGDQPEAIAALSEGIKSGVPFQTLLGVFFNSALPRIMAAPYDS